MAITNNEIVTAAWLELVAAGVIDEGETIHTFDYWKKSGYIVKRGSKAVCALMIWKHTTKHTTNDDGTEEETGKLFMKKAYFFSSSQVEKIQPVKRITAAELVGRPQTIQITSKRKTKTSSRV